MRQTLDKLLAEILSPFAIQQLATVWYSQCMAALAGVGFGLLVTGWMGRAWVVVHGW